MDDLISEMKLLQLLDISRTTGWRMRKRGDWPEAVMIRKRRRYQPEKILAYLEGKKVVFTSDSSECRPRVSQQDVADQEMLVKMEQEFGLRTDQFKPV